MSWEDILKVPFSANEFHFKNNNVGEEQAKQIFAEHIDPLFEQKRDSSLTGYDTTIMVHNIIEMAAEKMGMSQRVFMEWLPKLYPGIKVNPLENTAGTPRLELTLPAMEGWDEKNPKPYHSPDKRNEW